MSRATNQPEGMSAHSYARKLGRDYTTVRAWILAGKLKALNLAGPTATRPRYWITTEQQEEFERSVTVQPAPPVERRRKVKRETVTQYY